MTEYVCGFSGDGEFVLLVEKLKPVWMNGKLNGIGGKLEENEFPLDAMVREWAEEVGEKTELMDWRQYAKLKTDNNHIIHFFVRHTDKDAIFLHHFKNNDVGERMQVIAVRAIHKNSSLNFVSNLTWLIPLAFDRSKSFAEVLEPAPFTKPGHDDNMDTE